MLIALYRCIEDGFPLLEFKHIEKNDFANILKGSCEIPLFEDRLKILQEVTQTINERFIGKVGNLINAAKNDTQILLKLITENFPSFIDISQYKGKNIEDRSTR